MIVVTGEFRIPPPAIDAAREAMERVIAASRVEPGCQGYIYAEDVLEPGLFRVIEYWTDRAALDRHFTQPHMQRWKEERAELGMTKRHVTAHDVGASETL